MNMFDIIQKPQFGPGNFGSGAMTTPGVPGVPAIPLPEARCAMTVRRAVEGDLAFIDYLQKMHSHMVGFSPRKQLETNIADGDVLIAEERHEGTRAQRHEGDAHVHNHSVPSCPSASVPLGYCIAKDRYLKRDDVGIVYQLNVLPLKQRSLIGATLVKATFEKAAYGCKLFCCWCAQDIQANWFWESIGFIPLAFRTGSASKQRIHIFWQRRIRDNDETTPYWFPSQTSGGAVKEDRLVIPIPPGTHWRDAKPVVLPGIPAAPPQEMPKMLPGGAPVKARPEQPKLSAAQKAAIKRSQSKHLGGVPLGKKAIITAAGIKYVDRADYVPELDAPEELAEIAKPKRPKKERQKNDPKHVAAARELRDRYLEQVNSGLLLPPSACGKYDVSRALEAAPMQLKQVPLLKAA